MALPNPGMDAVPFTPLTAEFLDDMIENIESLSDGTGFEDGAITTNTLADNAVTAAKTSGIWWEELGRASLSSLGNTIVVSGLPKRKTYKVIACIRNSTTASNGTLLRINNNSTANNYTRSQLHVADNLIPTVFTDSDHIMNIAMSVANDTGILRGEITMSPDNRPVGYFFSSTQASLRLGGGSMKTSGDITSMGLYAQGGNMQAGSYLIVLGHD